MVKRTYNPIKREETYQSGFLPKIPIPEPKCAILLIARREGSRMMIITDESKIKGSHIKRGKYDYLAEIDMHQYNIQIEFNAMSNDQVSDFTISFSAIAVVTEPDIVYRAQIKDVAQHIENGILADIQGMAIECDISERDFLKRSIENKFGAQIYIDNGISVSNINVLVKSDEEYEKLLAERRRIRYKRMLDKDKSDAANEAKLWFSDAGSASYKEYIEGNITALEANAQWREENEKTFNMKMQQAQEFMKVGQQFEDSDWVNKEQLSQRAAEVLQGFTLDGGNSSVSSRIAMKNQSETVDSNLYREIED